MNDFLGVKSVWIPGERKVSGSRKDCEESFLVVDFRVWGGWQQVHITKRIIPRNSYQAAGSA